VLEVDVRKRKCSLTMKRSLVESSLPAITSYQDAAAGAPTLVSHGFVTAVRPGKGIVVTFFNNIFGFVSDKELEKAVWILTRF
jgi:rRNA biogenesis protein RRP5